MDIEELKFCDMCDDLHAAGWLWTAQAHDRTGWWNASAPTYKELREEITAECQAGRLWGRLYVTTPEGMEFDLTEEYALFGLRTDECPEPMIDEDEEAAA